MTAKELLKPRFEVIESYPNSKYEIGLILTNTVTDYFTYVREEKGFVTNIKNIEKYPHLFRKMSWWEGRTKDQMPKKLISMAYKDEPDFKIEEQEVHHIIDWDMEHLLGIVEHKKVTSVCSLASWATDYSYVPID